MAKIFSVELSDGKNNFMELDLPATDYQLLDMQDRLHLAPGELPEWEIYKHHGFEYLQVFLENECNLYELNALAQKLGEMERWQVSAFEGLFRMALDGREGPMSMDDIMTYANSTECCHVVSEATNDAKLGRFYADNGFVAELMDLPDSIYEKLDFARIGKEMREAEKGVYTKYGYVLRNDNLKVVTEQYSALPKTPNYTVQLLMARYPFDTDGQPEIVEALNLPATDDQLIRALEQVGAASWDEVVFEVEDSAVPRFFEKVEYIDGIHPVNELAQAIKQIEELGELTRYKAVIFISEYLRGGEHAKHLANRARYFATRQGVELLRDEDADKPATQKQQEFVKRLLRSYPKSCELLEYEDFQKAPTRGNAHIFIEQVQELYVDMMDDRENYVDYVANRPGVQTYGEHGLWDTNGKVPVLSRAIDEVANHDGFVWTPIVSIRREDAERLGYTDAENWRGLVNTVTDQIAKGYKINPEHLRWYAAFHQKEKHVHIHMLVFSTDPKEGYLTKQGIQRVKSAFARQIFRQDLIAVYEKQTEMRDSLKESAAEIMSRLISEMQNGTIQNEKISALVTELAQRLQNTSGKKVYGYLPATSKRLVDAIVDELATDPRVAEAYKLWYELRDEICRDYNEKLPERVPLSQQKEFKPVRNMVIRETMTLIENGFTFDDSSMNDEPQEDDESIPSQHPGFFASRREKQIYAMAERYRFAKKILQTDDADSTEKEDASKELEKLWNSGYTIAAHQLGKMYRDGLHGDADIKKAELWFRRSAEAGNDCSEYALGKLLLSQKRIDEAMEWLRKAADQNNQYARYRLGKVYLSGEDVPKDIKKALEYLTASAEQGNQFAQYTLGKLYLLGKDVKQDKEKAVEWLTRSAEQGNQYAQYFLDHQDDFRSAAVGSAIIRMLHHMGRIFQENTGKAGTYTGLQIDRKRRRKLQEKRIALGHKADDHEEQVQVQNQMQQTM